MSVRSTTDDPAKVIAFYRDKMQNSGESNNDGMTTLAGLLPDKRKITVMAGKNETGIEIVVSVETVAPVAPSGAL